jgi:hypothetical protein
LVSSDNDFAFKLVKPLECRSQLSFPIFNGSNYRISQLRESSQINLFAFVDSLPQPAVHVMNAILLFLEEVAYRLSSVAHRVECVSQLATDTVQIFDSFVELLAPLRQYSFTSKLVNRNVEFDKIDCALWANHL